MKGEAGHIKRQQRGMPSTGPDEAIILEILEVADLRCSTSGKGPVKNKNAFSRFTVAQRTMFHATLIPKTNTAPVSESTAT